MKNSISSRLVWRFSMTTLLVFSVLGIGLCLFLRAQLETQLKDTLQVRAGVAQLVISHAAAASDWPRVIRKLDNMLPAERNVEFLVQTPDPDFRYQSAANLALPSAPQRYVRVNVTGRSLLARTYLVPALGSRPDLVLVVYIDRYPVEHTTYVFGLVLGITFLIAGLAISVSGYTITRLGLVPLKRLSDEASALRSNVRGQRLAAGQLPRELQPLRASFNGALARIDTSQAKLDGFNADVAHELRTPISNIIGQAQVALTRERSNEALLHVIQSVLEESERMRVMVNDMLFLARADQGDPATELTPVSIAAEVTHALEFLEVPLEDAGVKATIAGDASTMANRSLLRRAMFNLLHNASQHATAGSEIRITIAPKPAAIEVVVANQGAPLPAAVLDRLFDRFYRGEASRSNREGSHGLGLSIVKAIAEMHQGAVFARSTQGWNEFGFTLPVAHAG
jgi:two-component system heavy metal sensor histidine kinase CusS